MSVWASAILSVSLLYGCVRMGLLYREHRRTIYMYWALMTGVYVLSSLHWLAAQLSLPQEQLLFVTQILEWLHITGVSLSLSVLALENWRDRPNIARYPFWLNFMPLLLLFSYILVYDTLYLKNILAAIYEAGALLTGLLLFGLFTSRSLDYLYSLIGLLLITLGFIMFWFPGGAAAEPGWVWKIFTAAGALSFISGYVNAQTNKMVEEARANSDFASSPSS